MYSVLLQCCCVGLHTMQGKRVLHNAVVTLGELGAADPARLQVRGAGCLVACKPLYDGSACGGGTVVLWGGAGYRTHVMAGGMQATVRWVRV